MGIAERVGGLVEASGLSQHEFARHAGLDETKLVTSLDGHRPFSSLDLARIAEYSQGRLCQCRTQPCQRQFPVLCQVTVDWLVTGEDPLSGTLGRVCHMPPLA